MPAFARVGRASLNVTAVAVPVPSLFTVIVKPAAVPATTSFESAVFVTEMCGEDVRQIPSRAVFVNEPDVTVAVLSRLALWPLTWIVHSTIGLPTPTAGAVVGLVTWTDAEAPTARSPKLQVRARPAIWQALAGVLPATDQVIPTPAIVGSG